MEHIDNPRVHRGKRFLRVNNVVRRIGVPERTIRHWAVTGRLNARRIGKKIWVFDPDEVEAFARQRRDYEAGD
jgi:predicted site-specific integrase-resolvase